MRKLETSTVMNVNMKQRTLFPLAALLLAFAVVGAAYGQTNIVSDNYDVSTSTTGFGLDHA